MLTNRNSGSQIGAGFLSGYPMPMKTLFRDRLEIGSGYSHQNEVNTGGSHKRIFRPCRFVNNCAPVLIKNDAIFLLGKPIKRGDGHPDLRILERGDFCMVFASLSAQLVRNVEFAFVLDFTAIGCGVGDALFWASDSLTSAPGKCFWWSATHAAEPESPNDQTLAKSPLSRWDMSGSLMSPFLTAAEMVSIRSGVNVWFNTPMMAALRLGF